jgi:hypothetical protein
VPLAFISVSQAGVDSSGQIGMKVFQTSHELVEITEWLVVTVEQGY